MQVPVNVPVPVKVKERVEVKVPVPFKVREPFPIRVPFPVPYAVHPEPKPEPTKPPPRPVIQLPPNIIHNFIPQPEHKVIAINRRPLIQHFYPTPRPEAEPEPADDPEPEPESEPESKEVDEESDLALLSKIEALRGQRVSMLHKPFAPSPWTPGVPTPNIVPLDPLTCLARGLAPGSVFIPGMGFMNAAGAPAAAGVHPFQGMRPPLIMNHLVPPMQAAFPGVGAPAVGPGMPAEQLNGMPGRGRNCHKICHEA